jgi:GTP-binding protein Era
VTEGREAAVELRSGMVTLLGWTNVGKSTLLNRLVGQKVAATADVAQTTRGRILGACHRPGAGQILFADTPGLHRPRHRLNRAMVEATERALVGVDAVLLVVDAARGLGPGDRQAAALVARGGLPLVVALNKIDLVRPKTKLLPLIAAAAALGPVEVVPVSAETGEGSELLVERLLRLLPVGPPLVADDFLTDQSERALAAEWIREKLLGRVRQELPHATAVHVVRWQERDDGLVAIEARIAVERESQKQIVVGRGGELLKQVGSEARLELERLLERRVFLELWVEVRPHWRDDERALRELGLA